MSEPLQNGLLKLSSQSDGCVKKAFWWWGLLLKKEKSFLFQPMELQWGPEEEARVHQLNLSFSPLTLASEPPEQASIVSGPPTWDILKFKWKKTDTFSLLLQPKAFLYQLFTVYHE